MGRMNEKSLELVARLAVIMECSETRVKNTPYVEVIEKLVDEVDYLKKFIDGELDERNKKVRELRHIIKVKNSAIDHMKEVVKSYENK